MRSPDGMIPDDDMPALPCDELSAFVALMIASPLGLAAWVLLWLLLDLLFS